MTQTLDREAVREQTGSLGGDVDPPDETRTVHGTITALAEVDRRPIVPAWLLSPDQRRQAGRWAASYAVHASAYHLSRTPKYAAKVAFRAPVGAGRLVWLLGRWIWDREGLPVRQAAISKADADQYLSLSKQRDRRIKGRLLLAGMTGLLGAAVAGLAVALAPVWVLAPAVGVGLTGLAKLGTPSGKQITDRVRTGSGYIRLTAELTRSAIMACNVGVKDAGQLQFPREIHRDGPGYTAIVDLPPGVVATDVIDKRDRLAGGFRLPKSQVWPSTVDGEHPGRLAIWVADRPVNSMRPPVWPLLNDGQTDYFKPFTFGFDERQRPVTWRFDERNSLFGGIPGSGKSFAVRVVVLGAALDPIVNLVCFELKGTGDFDCVEDLCLRYGSGADQGTKDAAMEALRWLESECDKRGPLVKQWAKKGLTSENKVNRTICERDARLRPIVAVFDEIQELFTDPDHKKEATALATSIVKRGRALGIHLILATQRIDKESVPRGISSNMGIRFCMAVTSHIEADMVLGTGAFSRGARPTEFEPGPDSGWGYRAGLGRTAPMCSALVNNEGAAKVVARAKQLRAAAGTLARPDSDVVIARDVLADVRGVFYAGQAHISWPALAARLAETWPETYAGMTGDAISARVRAYGIASAPVRDAEHFEKGVGQGLKLAALTAALQARELTQAA